MQDGAPPHIERQVIALFRAHFGDERVISRGFRTTLPPHSLDLNLCDFQLWRFLKDHAYRRNIETVPEFKESITRYVSSIDRETIPITVEHTITRFEYVIEAKWDAL